MIIVYRDMQGHKYRKVDEKTKAVEMKKIDGSYLTQTSINLISFSEKKTEARLVLVPDVRIRPTL